MRAYLVAFYDPIENVNNVAAYLGGLPDIKNWQTYLPSTIFVVTELDAHSLAVLIHNRFPNANFLATELTSSKDGWMPLQVWNFINKPTAAPPVLQLPPKR